ncbi:MAG: response regulator [Pirellulales bacterium]
MKFESATKKSRILIVEDELIVSADIAARLTLMGYEVVGQVDEASQALERFRATQPDLLLMDIRLKGSVDGITLAETIRSQSSVPVVFLTAHADDSTLQRVKITEPHGYILKPFDERELKIVVEVALYRAMTERRLAENQQFLSTILASIADSVVACDGYGKISYVNMAAEKWLGQASIELLGTSVTALLSLKDVWTEQPIHIAEMLGASDHETLSREVWCAAQGSQLRRVLLSVAKLEHGLEPGAVVLVRDVTEQRKLEAGQWQSQRMEALGQLAAGIAHDLNNLLTVVYINSQLLLEMPVFDDSEIELLENITKATDRASKMTQQLLTIGRKRVMQPRYVDLNVIISNYQNIIERMMSPDVYSLFELHREPLEIYIDPTQVEEILFNLAMYSRIRMSKGGRITIRSSKVEKTPEFGDTNAAVLEVIDTGLGLNESDKLRIWEPFNPNSPSGTELSLAAVYGIVQQSNRMIQLTSQIDLGSAFRVLWQLAKK